MYALNNNKFMMQAAFALICDLIFCVPVLLYSTGTVPFFVIVTRGALAAACTILAFLSFRNFRKMVQAEFEHDNEMLYKLKSNNYVISIATLSALIIYLTLSLIFEIRGFPEYSLVLIMFKLFIILLCLHGIIWNIIACRNHKNKVVFRAGLDHA